MPGVDQELANFHLIVDDSDAMYLKELVRGHHDIHVYVKHPIHDPILVDEGQDAGGEGVQPLALDFYDSDGMYANDQTFNNEDELEVNADVPTKLPASQVGSRRVDKEPIIEHPPEVFHISDSSDNVGSYGEGSSLEDDVELNHGVRDFVEDSSDSWDGKDDANVNEPGQMGAGIMNSDYESEELHSLVESSSDDELGYDSDDKSKDDNSTHRVRAVCQKGCKFITYLTKVPRERSYQLRTLTLEHTCSRSYKNPRCTSSYIGKKLMKKVKRQPNIKLKDIQEAIHEKYSLTISAGKASRARDKAREYVDGDYTQQYNQLWEYCEELRRASTGSTILMKVHTFHDSDLAAEMDLVCGVPYFERLYICLEGCKKGFLAGCRPFIGLDACHLKNKSEGQLITAVCRDPNEEYFPLAYAVVEAKTKDSWTWFINLLLANIGQNRRWVFMSDQQKLECIRLYLMTRFQDNRKKILRVESDICAKVLKRLHMEKVAASRQDAEQYVHPCYHVSTYKAYYEPIIAPINGQNMWRPSDVTPVQPPIKRRPLGKPKKKRAREPNEPTSRRAGISKQCKAYGKLGHNRRSCKGKISGNSSLPSTTNRTSTSKKASMHSFSSTPSAPPQSSMHSPSMPSAPYLSSKPSFRPGAPHQSGSTTQNLGAHQNSSSTNPNSRQKNTRVVTSETLKASKNASRYMEAIIHSGSQSSVHGPRK
ncbi:hypothetical protein SO802_034047 [Lithocarpus litseifolius]|uniref:MULE transposase domain-containing protein n=1 Tax=Lithocarpus litseifolius TaxID=425828 RepID=A0AAW2BFI3_9ROSI